MGRVEEDLGLGGLLASGIKFGEEVLVLVDERPGEVVPADAEPLLDEVQIGGAVACEALFIAIGTVPGSVVGGTPAHPHSVGASVKHDLLHDDSDTAADALEFGEVLHFLLDIR